MRNSSNSSNKRNSLISTRTNQGRFIPFRKYPFPISTSDATTNTSIHNNRFTRTSSSPQSPAQYSTSEEENDVLLEQNAKEESMDTYPSRYSTYTSSDESSKQEPLVQGEILSSKSLTRINNETEKLPTGSEPFQLATYISNSPTLESIPNTSTSTSCGGVTKKKRKYTKKKGVLKLHRYTVDSYKRKFVEKEKGVSVDVEDISGSKKRETKKVRSRNEQIQEVVEMLKKKPLNQINIPKRFKEKSD